MRPRSGSSLASKAALTPAPPDRPSIPRCRICCWQRERSALARLGRRCACSSRRKRRPHSDCHPASTRMPCCRSATPWAGLDPSAVSHSPKSSTKIGGASLTGMCSDPKHPASLPKRLPAHLPASVIVVCRTGRRFGHHRHTRRHFEANAAGQALVHRKCDRNATVVN